MTAIYVDVNIAIHGSFVVTSKDKTYVVVGIRIIYAHVILLYDTCLIGIIPRAIHIHDNLTLHWHVRRT